MLSIETLHDLLTPQGQRALELATTLPITDASLLADLQALRRVFPADLAAAALETIWLRRRARPKFSRAAAMFFTREALEQASGEMVARHRATRYADIGAPVWDVCCSIGGDALPLAAVSPSLHGIDRDPLRVAMARLNAAACDLDDRAVFEVRDALTFTPDSGALLFFDPARRSQRSGGRRIHRPDEYEPPLSLIDGWIDRARGFGVKVAPGINYEALPYTCEVEVVSVAGDVKEVCLWFGALRRHDRSATLLDAHGTTHALHAAPGPIAADGPPRRFLYEPDGAVIRAHLIDELARRLDATKLDPTIAFLSADRLRPTPFARAFEVIESLPFNLKRLRDRLRERQVGRVVIKKRGSPLDPQALEQQLRLRPNAPHQITIVLTRVLGTHTAILCQPVDPAAAESRG